VSNPTGARCFSPDFCYTDLREDDRGGTLAPFLRASESPIAIACLRLVTRPPCPDFPLFNVPLFRRRMALSTDLDAASPYRRPPDFLIDLRVGIVRLP